MTSIQIRFRASMTECHEGTLCYCIVHQRAVRWITTNYHVFPDEWDDKKKCVVVGKRKDRKAQLHLIRSMLDWEVTRFQSVVSERKSAFASCSVDEVVSFVRGLPPCQSAFSFMQKLIDEKEEAHRFGTRNNYSNAYRRFCEFRHSEDLTFTQMDSDMIGQYEAWLKFRGLRQNSIAFYLRILRTFYRKAIEAGLAVNRDIFAHVQTNSVRTFKRAVTAEVIQRIRELKLPHGSALDFARDLFLFSFYMRGMSFVDMAYLRKTDLKCDTVTYNRRKTNQTLAIEWENTMQAVVDKYAEQTKDSPYLLPILTKDTSNPYAHYKHVEQRVNVNLKKIGKMVGLKMPLTTYVARHTWASIAMRINVPLAVISEGMGHSSFRTTQIYLQSIDESTVNQANREIIRQVLGVL